MLADRYHRLVLALSLSLSTTLIFCARGGAQSVPGPTAFVPSPYRSDMTEDSLRKVLYISGTDGNVMRYDLTSKSFLEPVFLGGTLRGMDISPDFSSLIVAGSHSAEGANSAGVIELATGSSRLIQFPYDFYEGDTYSAVFIDNQTALVDSRFAGSGWVPLRRIDLVSGMTASEGSIRQDSMLCASADRSVVAIAESNMAPSRIKRYRVSDGSIAASASTFGYLSEIAVNRDGHQYALPTKNVAIFDENLQELGAVKANNITYLALNVTYNPVADEGYVIWTDSGGFQSEIDVFDTNTLAIKRVLDRNAHLSLPLNGFAFQSGGMRVSPDGLNLFVSVDGGVNIYAVPEPSSSLLIIVGFSALLLLKVRPRRHRS
jgi:hypothetical protein